MSRFFKSSITVTGSLALSIALARCSPIAASVSKFRPSLETNPLRTSTTAVEGIDASAVVISAHSQSKLRQVPARLLSQDEYETGLEAPSEAQEQKIALSAETRSEDFNAFRQGNAIELKLNGTPDACGADLAVPPSGSDGAAERPEKVTIDCSLLKNGNWGVSLSESMDLKTLSWVEKNLLGAVISVKLHAQAAVSRSDHATDSLPSKPASETRSL